MRTPIVRVTLIDDNEDDVLIMSQLLERAGLPGVPPRFGEVDAALAHLRGVAEEPGAAGTPQVVLAAVCNGGFDLLRRVRMEEALRSTMVILLSGTDEPRNIGKAIQLQADGYLVKFPSLHEMREVLTEVARLALLPVPRPVLQVPSNLLQAAVPAY